MKKQLLPLKNNFFKTAMHVHTTVSDGKLTPQELKEYYQKHGYSVVAYTDHEVIVPHNDLTDDKFLAITSYEVSINKQCDIDCYDYTPTYHLNVYLPDKDAKTHFAFSKKEIWFEADQYISEELANVNYDRVYSIDCVNDIIKKTNELGGFVSYNHPYWSLQTEADYLGIKDCWGIEVYNHGSIVGGWGESPLPFDTMLKTGKRIFPLAVDDSHSIYSACGGWLMVSADNLEYGEVFNALKKGDFYSSTGPEIKDIYFEDGFVYVKTSNAKQITLSTECRTAKNHRSWDGKGVEYAKFDIKDYLQRIVLYNCDKSKCFIRITVDGFDGTTAWSRAYFYDELV